MNIFLLLEIVILIFLISLAITKDIFSPACIMCESYILAIISTIFNIRKWDVNIHSNTVFIIVFGIICFIIISVLVNVYYKHSKVKQDKKLEFIRYNKKMMFILIFIQFFSLFIYLYFFIKSLGDLSRFESINHLMRYFRLFINIEEDIPLLVNQLLKYSKALAYVSGYIFIHNKFIGLKTKQKTKDNFLIISIIIFILMSLLTAARFEMMILILSFIMMWYIITIFYGKLNKNFWKKIICVFLVAIILFSASQTLVGRENKTSAIDSFSEYFGGSIEIFDSYLQDVNQVSNREELFKGVLKFLRQLKLIDSLPVDTGLADYVESNGQVVGNVYTGFRRMHHDFGLFGVMIFQMIMALLLTIFYEKIKHKKSIDNISIGIIFYSAIAFSMFLHSYSEFFFSTIISFNYLAFLVLIIIIKFCITKIKF